MTIIDLDSCKNVRDISYGNIKDNNFIRSSSLENVANEDFAKLYNDYNVRTIIDLRSNNNAVERPDILYKDVNYYNIPLMKEKNNNIINSSIEERVEKLIKNMPSKANNYIEMVKRDNKEKWTKIFNIILNNNDGAILFHCNQGKDRTGIVAAIIEKIFGIDDSTIISDYMLSNNYSNERANKVYDVALKITNDKDVAIMVKNEFMVKEEYIKGVFDYINREYGDFNIFLNEICSLNEEKINMLRDKYLISGGNNGII